MYSSAGCTAISCPAGGMHALTAGILALLLAAVTVVLFVVLRRRRKLWTGEAEQYRLIAQSSGDVFFRVPCERDRIAWMSDPGADLLGYEKEAFDPQIDNIEQWVHRDDVETMREAWACLLEAERIDLDLRLRKKNGKDCWVHLFALPTGHADAGQACAVGVVRRTQDLHDIQAELAEARRLQSVGTMAGGIAHEFNNHLTPIRGFIELALDSLGNHPVAEGLQTALNRVEYCTELVAQIQAYGRKSLLLPEPVDLRRLLPSVIRIAMSSYHARPNQVALEEEYTEDLPELWVDQAQFQQAMVQLVRNAIEAMPRGGTLNVRVDRVYTDRKTSAKGEPGARGNYFCICIRDTGVGIPESNLEQIFDPFFTTHKRADKRGMGLPMVQGMAAQHGGWMEIKSEPGKGTEVRLYLPQKQVEVEEKEPVAVDEDGTMTVLPAATVGRMLIGDDENLIRSLIRKVFEAEGWEVDEASDFDEVLSSTREQPAGFDVIVLDLSMNGPPAETVVDSIIESHPDAKILMISGFGRDSRVENLLQKTGGQFVSKPFSPKDLLSRVDELIAGS